MIDSVDPKDCWYLHMYNIYIFGVKSLEHLNINILLKEIPNLMKYVVFIPPDFKVLHFV